MSADIDFINIDPINKAKGLCHDSRQVKPGDLFLAYPGGSQDGRCYISEAIARGAIGVLAESGAGMFIPADCPKPVCEIEGLAWKVGEIASRFYGHPSRKQKIIAVTGTNGKTTCTYLIAQALEKLGKPCGLVGTLGTGTWNNLVEGVHTTPDPLQLHAVLANWVAQGVSYVALEASSHGLDQGRLNGAAIDVAVLTNLTQDHLDYHGSMQAYQAAKTRLFEWPGLSARVVNTQNEFGKLLANRKHAGRFLAYAMEPREKVDAEGVCIEQFRVKGDRYQVDVSHAGKRYQFFWPLWGRYNLENTLAAMGALLGVGVDLDQAGAVLGECVLPPGRLQPVGDQSDFKVFVDYAHTPDALQKVLETVRALARARVILVFGCGGNRDQSKRAQMGKIAGKYSDLIFVTSDNPRLESPQNIISQIITGIESTGSSCHVEPDRAQAIAQAIEAARPGDVVLIAGKGHEQYQIIGHQKIHFSDRTLAENCLRRASVCG